jgi:hypothetical protein
MHTLTCLKCVDIFASFSGGFLSDGTQKRGGKKLESYSPRAQTFPPSSLPSHILRSSADPEHAMEIKKGAQLVPDCVAVHNRKAQKLTKIDFSDETIDICERNATISGLANGSATAVYIQ